MQADPNAERGSLVDGNDKNMAGSSALAGLMSRAQEAGSKPPLHQWNPPDCGPIPMRITADGTWHYAGSPIGRPSMVRLFASLLRREADGRFVLVTPVEMVTIEVEDAPFLAVEMALNDAAPPALVVRTNLGDAVAIGPSHALRFSTGAAQGSAFVPYITVRPGIEARFTRALAMDLADLLVERDGTLGIDSGGGFFPVNT